MIVAFALLMAGWSLIAGSQPKQYGRVFHGRHLSGPLRKAIRGVGVALLLAALAVMARSDSAAFAVLSWVCLLSVSAMLVALILAWLPRWVSARRPQADSVTGRRQRT
ncbi:hypothetical protein UNPF46_24500 [Bradyrhizobium sp. UNPF46]|uniref:DUF3325 domain-containing protein n=1 Tax=Bradyrhizobium sp. UNPF46 TaxID=1141168 RepID=UPI0011536A1A|nr:DUF3325 domain-containing protein [Bradyrhizobium sp. UNPF46]TQF35409.1 hypothetical protein UNPF46_24500 [Bradyrhizobium sp. UNPF46]